MMKSIAIVVSVCVLLGVLFFQVDWQSTSEPLTHGQLEWANRTVEDCPCIENHLTRARLHWDLGNAEAAIDDIGMALHFAEPFSVINTLDFLGEPGTGTEGKIYFWRGRKPGGTQPTSGHFDL